MKTIDIHKSGQALEGDMTDYSATIDVRAVIKRDAYDSQSYGIAQAWTPNGWTDIQRFPIDCFMIQDMSYVSDEGTWETVMESDLRSLIKYAHNHMKHINKEDN